MTRAALTLLQRAVIDRLRSGGYPAIADCARDAWTRGEPCRLPVHITDPQLLADYERANGHASAKD